MNQKLYGFHTLEDEGFEEVVKTILFSKYLNPKLDLSDFGFSPKHVNHKK
jgi:hypothetical protein